MKQSDSPLAQQLLAVDNIYNEDGEVILGQKGWFDSDQVREERRIKKLKQIMKMVFFLQVSKNLTIMIFAIFQNHKHRLG